MEISVSQSNDALVFTLIGEVDERGAQQLKETFNQNYRDNVKTVVFDFQQVNHIGSAGIGKLLLFYKKVGINKGSIIIEKPNATILDLFNSLKLDSVFTIKTI